MNKLAEVNLDLLCKAVVVGIHGPEEPPSDQDFWPEYAEVKKVVEPVLMEYVKVIQQVSEENAKLRVSREKFDRMRQAVRTLNRSMREKRYQIVRRRSAELNRMAEELCWAVGRVVGDTKTFTWFRLTKEEYHQYRNARAIQVAADRLAEELGICTNPKEPSVVKALTDYFKAKALP